MAQSGNISHNNLSTEHVCLKLTRFLYPKDEAELSLLLSLLERKPCGTCLFWACELIYSGFDISHLIWSIYYDFYAQLNPGLFKKIAVALEKLRIDGNIDPILMVIKTMRVRQATDNVFSLRISQTPTKFTVYRGRVPSWLVGFSPEKRPLIRAICKYDWNQIMVYINNKIGDPKDLIKAILKVMIEKKIIEPKQQTGKGDCNLGECGSDTIVDTQWNNYGYDDEFHIILALIVSLITPDEQIDFTSRLIKLNDNEREYLANLNQEDSTNRANTPGGDMMSDDYNNYNKLLLKRLCSVDEGVGSFDITRLHIKRGFVEEIADKWAYHCSQTPYWVQKFQNPLFDAYLCGNGSLGFRNDVNFDKQELFANMYGFFYELDEPFMRQMWKITCESICLTKDIVEKMEDIFGNDEKQIRINFEDITLSNERKPYEKPPQENNTTKTNMNGITGNEVFDFTVLNKLLDSI